MSPIVCAGNSATMTATENNLRAKIRLDDVGKTADGRRAVAYRVELRSSTCNSIISGVATYFSNTDDAGDDSAYLPNGYAVQINAFKDKTQSGEIKMFVDVESKRPRYVYFSVTHATVISNGCVPAEGFGIGFYSKSAYKRMVSP